MISYIEEKEFRFQGLDRRTEMRLSLMVIPIAVVIVGGVFVGMWVGFSLNFDRLPVKLMTALIFGLVLAIFGLVVKRAPHKEWVIRVVNNRLLITFGDKRFDIPLENLRRIENMGQQGFRYLTLVTQDGQQVRIRAGVTAMTPFSKEEDLHTVDQFIKYLKPYIDKHFNQKILKNKIVPSSFPNYGIYIVKSETIKYSFINKMTPGQVIIFGLALGLLFVFLMLQVLFYFID